MASIQQSMNSTFNTALASALSASHAFQNSALGKRMTEIRELKADIKTTNKAGSALLNEKGEVDPHLPDEQKTTIENLAEKGANARLAIASKTGSKKDVIKAADALKQRDTIYNKVYQSRAEKARFDAAMETAEAYEAGLYGTSEEWEYGK